MTARAPEAGWKISWVLGLRTRHFVMLRDIPFASQPELADHETEDRRRAVCYDRVLDAVEVRPPTFPEVGVSRHRDPFVRLEFAEFEGAGAFYFHDPNGIR